MALSVNCRLQETAIAAGLNASKASLQHGQAFPTVSCSLANIGGIRSRSLSVVRRTGCLRTSHSLGLGTNVEPQSQLQSRNRRRQRLQCRAAVKEVQHASPASTSEEMKMDNSMQFLHSQADELERELQGANIFLIGMMGCGKTTVGRILSEVLGYGFFDSDTVVEQAVGTSVANIFTEQGEAAFRDLESQAVSQLASMEGLVVATGGGAILRPENWRCMRSGIVVWIDVPIEALAKRVVAAGVGSRPILSQGSSNEDAFSQALNRLRSVYEKRKHLYPQADIKVSLQAIAEENGFSSVADISPAKIALEILKEVKELVSQRSHAWQTEGTEAECIFNEYGQCTVPYGLESAEKSSLRQGTLVSH